MILARLGGLLRAPTATWLAIAEEGDSRAWLFRRYLPVLALLPWLIGAIIGLPEGLASRQQEVVHLRPGAGGDMVTSAGVTMTLAPTVVALVLMPFALAFAYLAAMLMRDMLLQAVPRHGAPADPLAATKLAIYGQTGFWIGSMLAFLPFLGLIGWFLGIAYGFWLLRRGALLLLPPAPGREAALRRTVMLRALFASVAAGAIVAIGACIVLIILVTQFGLDNLPMPRPLPRGTIQI